jgi:prolipoprotein diacylglyceryl transferase
MYPNLSYLFHDLFGTPPDNGWSVVQTFGFMMALAFIAAAYFLYSELKRKAAEGLLEPKTVKVMEGEPVNIADVLLNAVLGFILGYKLIYLFQHYTELQDDLQGFLLSMKGSWLLGIVGAVVLGGLKFWEQNKKKLPKPVEKTYTVFPHDRTGDITIVAAISGLVGAKVFSFFESAESMQSFLAHPVEQFFSGSGLAIYGGLIGGFLGVRWYIRKLNIPFWQMADAVSPSLIMGYAIGRLGCHFSGDGDWGIVAGTKPSWWFLPDWLWSYDYPRNVSEMGEPLANCVGNYCTHLVPGVYPTPIYETFMALIIFAILWSIRKNLKTPGTLFFIYMILNGIERFFIEKIRVNDKLHALGLTFTQAEFIAIAFVLIGGIGLLWLRSRGKVSTEA